MGRRPPQGFSLVELMVVIAIIGIMAGLTAPSLLSALPGMRANGATRQVLSDLRLARTTSVQRGRPVVVQFDAANRKYVVAVDVNNDGAYTAADDTLLKTVVISDDYKDMEFNCAVAVPVKPIDLNAAHAVVFLPNGSASVSGNIYLMPTADVAAAKSDRNKRVVVAGPTGTVHIESYSTGAWQ